MRFPRLLGYCECIFPLSFSLLVVWFSIFLSTSLSPPLRRTTFSRPLPRNGQANGWGTKEYA